MKKTLFSKDFSLVVIGQMISLFGNAAIRFALPLYLLNLTGSSALYGTVTACALLPALPCLHGRLIGACNPVQNHHRNGQKKHKIHRAHEQCKHKKNYRRKEIQCCHNRSFIYPVR